MTSCRKTAVYLRYASSLVLNAEYVQYMPHSSGFPSLDLDPFTKPIGRDFVFSFITVSTVLSCSPGDPGGGKGQQKLGDVVQGQSHHPVDRGADHEALPGHEKI